MVEPRAAPLSTNYSDAERPELQALKRHGESSPLTGLAFVVRDARRAASWTGPKQFQCGAGNAPLQSKKLPISVPRASSARICRGLDVASFYLWFRADERRGDDRALRSHSKANEKRRWCSGVGMLPQR